MNKKEYIKTRNNILRYYAKLEKKYIHQQESGSMMIALQHEKNDRLIELTKRRYEDYKCKQCGAKMNPIDYMVGSVCMKCCKKNQAQANGKTKKETK